MERERLIEATMLIISLMLSCGNKEQDTGTSSTPNPVDTSTPEPTCPELTPDQCSSSNDCMGITGVDLEIDSTLECYTVGSSLVLGCMNKDLGCGDAITYAAPADSPTDCYMFMDTCIPEGWNSCNDLNSYTECNEAACTDVSPDECSIRTDCQTITGNSVTTEDECYSLGDYEAVGCTDGNIACEVGISYASAPESPDQCFQFQDGCWPENWTACTTLSDLPECVAECSDLTPSECSGNSDCMGIVGAEVTLDTNRNCLETGALGTVGCMASDLMCGDAITYAASPDSPDACYMFLDTCIPEGWQNCTDLNSYPECQ